VLIVTYHHIATTPSPVSVTSEQLASDLTALEDAGFSWTTLDACADWLAGGAALPARSAVITFDDGYASVATSGLPLLQRFGVPATVFVIAGRIGGDNQWPGQWKDIAREPLLDARAIGELTAAGMSLGCHSLSHPRLTELDGAALQAETLDAADRLEQVTRAPVRHFAYPYGIRGGREIEMARKRFRTALTADCGVVTSSSEAFELPRFDAHDLRVAARLRLLGAPGLAGYAAIRRAARRMRAR
jgi:peptidoglycan/xylan/chitin deacetylase (PgdA/CDA1 family)